MRKLAVAVLLGLLGFACGGESADDITVPEGSSGTSEPTDDAYGAATEEPEATGGDHGTATFTDSEFTTEVELDDFYFEPTTIKAPGGAKATLELRNEGDATHTFTIDSLDVDEEVTAGAERTITIDDLGTDTRVEYYCRFHRDSQDMKGSFSLH